MDPMLTLAGLLAVATAVLTLALLVHALHRPRDRKLRRQITVAVCLAIVGIEAIRGVQYGSLEHWPLRGLLTMLFAGGLLAAVAARESRSTGSRWPWAPIGIVGVAIAATSAVIAVTALSDILR